MIWFDLVWSGVIWRGVNWPWISILGIVGFAMDFLLPKVLWADDAFCSKWDGVSKWDLNLAVTQPVFFLPKMNFKWDSNLVEVFEFVEDVDEVRRRSWCEIVTFRKLLLILFIFSFNFSVIVDRFAAALHLNRKFNFATGSNRRKQIKAFVK